MFAQLPWLFQQGELTPEQAAAVATASLVSAVCGLILAVIFIAAYWRIFSKAGKPGWAAIIPIYSTIVLLDIVGKPWWWILLFLIPVVNIIIVIMVAVDLARAFGHGTGFAIGLILLAPIFILILAFGDSRYQGAPR